MRTTLFISAIFFIVFILHESASQSSDRRNENATTTDSMEREADQEKMMDPFDSTFQMLHFYDKISDKGCELEKAKHCFIEYANATVHAMFSPPGHEIHRQSCRYAAHYRTCMEESGKACKMDDANKKYFDSIFMSYVKMLDSVSYTACMQKSENDKEEKMEDMERSCDLMSAGHCIMGFMYVGMDMSSKMAAYDRSTGCWQAQQSLSCLATSMMGCSSPRVRSSATAVANQIRLSAQELCIMPGCHPDVATESLMTFKNVFDSPMSDVKTVLLCPSINILVNNAVSHVKDCPIEVYGNISSSIYIAAEIMHSYCAMNEMPNYGEGPMISEVLTLGSVSSNPLATRKDVCPMVEMAMKKLMKMSEDIPFDLVSYTMDVMYRMFGSYCMEDKMKGDCSSFQSKMCDMNRAKACVAKSRIDFYLSTVEAFGAETVCEEMQKMTECVQYMLSGCEDNDRMSWMEIDPRIKVMFMKIADHCPLTHMGLSKMHCLTERTCDVNQALMECFPQVDMSTVSQTACQHVNRTVKCVARYSDCGGLPVFQSVAYTMKMYLLQFKPYCVEPAAEIITGSIPKCTHASLDAMMYLLTTSKNFTRDFCYASAYIANMTECQGVEHLPAVLRYGTMQMQEKYKMYWEKNCMEEMRNMNMSNMDSMEMESRPVEPAGCNSDYAAACLTVHWERLLNYPFTPLDQRKELCYAYHGTVECVKNMTMNCSAERQDTFKHAMKMVDHFHKASCPLHFYDLIQGEKCNTELAMGCISMVGDYMATASAFHDDYHCYKLAQAMECVYNNTRNCSAAQLAPVKDAMTQVQSLVGNSCANVKPELCDTDMINNLTMMMMNEGDTMCDEAGATECLDLFTNAQSLLMAQGADAVCGMSAKAAMCAWHKSYNCSTAFKDSINTRINVTKTALMATCEDHESWDMENMTCPALGMSVQCTIDIGKCFLLTMEATCQNASKVRDCLTLHLRGCDDTIFTSTLVSLKVVQTMYNATTGLGCDFTPTPRANFVAANITADSLCSFSNDIIAGYFYNNSATEINICHAFSNYMECERKSMGMLKGNTWSELKGKVVDVIQQQVNLRCKAASNMNIVYMDTPKNASEYEYNSTICKVPEATFCMNEYMRISVSSGNFPLADRKNVCKSKSTYLTCIYNSSRHCPETIKRKILRGLDWASSIGRKLGVCNEEKTRVCEPHKAMECLSMYGAGIMQYGGVKEATGAICSGFMPVEICVKEYSTGCDANMRMLLENSFMDMASVATRGCGMNEMSPPLLKYEARECDVEKVRRCAVKMFTMARDMVDKKDKEDRKEMCGEMMESAKCVAEMSMGCDEETKKVVEAHKPLMELVMSSACFEDPSMEMEMTKETAFCYKTAAQCLVDYVHVTVQNSLTGFCAQVPTTISCFKSVMTTCGDDGQQTLGMLSRHMWEAAHSMCGSDKCNPTLAAVCNAERNALFAVPLMRIKESKIMCDALKMATACVARHTMHCEAKDIPLLAEDQATSHWLMGHICKDERPNTVLQSSPTWDAESLMAISVLLRNPHVNKEALCPAYNVLMSNLQTAAFMVSAKEYAEMQGHMYMTMSIVREYCMDDMSMGWMGADLDKVRMANTTAQCNMTALFQCGMEADLYNKMTASVFYGWQPVCSALEKMICCVEHATGGCRDHKHRLAAAQAYREAFGMVGNHCPVEQISEKAMYSCAWPKPKKCELVNAIEKCLPTISTNDDKNKICSDLPTITTCVKEYTEGCTSTQAAPLVFILKKYKEWKQSDCDLSRTNVDITPVDSMNNITKCHMDSMEVMYNGIMRSTNMSVVMCQAVVSVYDCYSKLSYLPLEIQYRLTAGENDAHMLEMCRNMTRDQTAVTLPAESPNCMLDMASLCFVPYLVHLTDLELTPVHERMEYCSKILDVGYCMMSAVSSCSSQRQEMMTAGIEVLKEQFQRVCPNILPAIAKMDYVCAPETAESCISYFGAYMTMASGSSDSNEEVCRHFHMTSKCVADSSKNCTADVKMRLEASLHNAKVLMGNTCPLLNTIMCNTSMFYDVMDIKCNGEAAKKCMGDFEQFRNQNRGNMTAICGMYHHTMECLAKNTLTCQEKDTSTFNATVYLTGASIGQECYRLMNQSQMQAVAMRNPMSTTLGMCMEQPECSVLWIHCLGEEMDPEKICGNSAEIRACIHKKLEGCDNNTRLSVVQDVRRFAMDIPTYYNGSCPFADEVIMESNNVTQYFYNNTCLRHFTRNVTAMLNTGSYNNSVSCRLFTSTMAKCLHNETSNPYYPALYKGIFMSIAQTLREHSCMDLVASDVADGEAMTPEVNASFMAYRMNNSELYNMTFKEPASCQMQTAKMCFEYYASGTTYMGSLPLNDRKMFCKDRAMSFKCVVNATKTCSAMTRHRMMEALYMMASIGHSIGTCNHVDMAAMETRQQNSEMSMTCDQDGALKCLGSLGQAIAMHHMMPTRQSICSHLQPTEMCVIKNTWHCMPEVRKAMESTYNDLKTLAMGACGKADKPKDDMMDSSMECSMKEEEKTCNREAALYCITSAHSKVMADGRTENMCRMMPQLRDCVKKNIMGCDKCQQDTVKQMLSSLYARVAKECPSVMCDKCAAASCMAALNMTHTKSNATCMDVMKTKQCVEMHTKHCETHVSHEMRSHMNEMIMKMKVASCPMDMKFTTCALHFGSVAQQILRIPKDVLPNMEVPMDMMGMQDGREMNMTASNMTATQTQTMIVLAELMRMISNEKPGECKATMYAAWMPKTHQELCMEAKKAGECMENMMHHLSPDMVPVVNSTMWAIGQAVTGACMDTTMMCHKCKGAKDNEECNSMPVEYCRGPHQACFTKVDHTDGKHMIHKGCTKRLPMLKSHSCTHNNTRCTYYCDKPGCNMDAYMGIEDDESCDTRKAAVCGMTLMHDMLSSGKMDCRKMKEHLYCMSHHTKKCVSVSDQAMHHQVKKVLGSRAMMRCYAEPMPCRCGRCMGMTFMGYVQSITSTDYDVCSMVPAVSKSMMASLIFDDCSGSEVDDMHWSMHYARRVLGDMCGMKPLGIKPYNPKCSIDSAKMCLTAVGLKGILRDLPTEHSEDVCRMVYRMLGCAQMHTSECDVRDAVTQIGSHLQDMMSMVHDRCNVSYAWKKLNETQEAIRNNAQLDSFKDAIAIKMEDEVEKRIERIQGLMTTANNPANPICKPSLALHHCFSYFEEYPTNLCLAANMSHSCIDLLTSGCLAIQRAPVIHVLYNYISADIINNCGFPKFMSPEMVKMAAMDPYANMSLCSSNYTFALQTFMRRPSRSSHYDVCVAAVMMERCVYYSDLPSIVKLPQAEMAEVALALSQKSCAGIDSGMSNMTCEEEDVLCHLAKNMSTMQTDMFSMWDNLPAEADSCKIDYAVGCIGSYTMRLLTSAFAPKNDYDDICWEFSMMTECVTENTKTCTFLRKQQFQMAVDWFNNLTAPVCRQVVDMTYPSCDKAHMCLKTMMTHMLDPKSYVDMDQFCWGVKRTVDCVKQHAYNCTGSKFNDVIESLYILGNGTHESCPGMSSYICPVTAMKPKQVGAECQLSKMQSCVSSFYNETYNKTMTEPDYCMKLENYISCVEMNSSNCHPMVVEEIYELMVPGVLHANYNCSILTQKVMEATSCRTPGKCPMLQLQIAAYEKAMEIQSRGGNCVEMANFVAQMRTNTSGCNSVEIDILNFGMQKFVSSLSGSTSFTQCLNTQNFMLSGDMNYNLPNYTQCARQLTSDLTSAMKTPRYGFYDLCMAASNYNTCLSNEFMDVNGPYEMIMMATMNDTHRSISEFLKNDCAMINQTTLTTVQSAIEPADCRSDMAVACVVSYAVEAMNIGLLSGDNMYTTCSMMGKIAMECVRNNTMTCSADLQYRLRTLTAYTYKLAMDNKVCYDDTKGEMMKELMRSMADRLYGKQMGKMYYLGDLVMSFVEERAGHSDMEDTWRALNNLIMGAESGMTEMNMMGREMGMSEGMDDNKDDMNDGKDDDEDDKMEDMMMMMNDSHPMCKPRPAAHCIKHVVAAMANTSDYSYCHSFERVQKCVMMNTKYCSATTHMMAAKSLMQVTFMARSFCQMAMMVHEMMNMATDDDMNRDTTNMTMRNMSADMMEGYGQMMNFSDREGGMGDRDSMRSGPFDMSKMREEIESRVESFMMGNARMISDLSLDGKEHVLDAIMELGKVGMEDEPCVDPMKYRDMATCNPQRAFDCMAAVDKEMLNPFMTRERLCMKHALAVRCYVLMSHGCNQMTAHTMKITFDYMMYKVGDRCDTHVKSPCMDMKSKCQLWEVPKCLNELHMAVSYGRYFLPGSTTQMCMSAEKAKHCVTEKIEHCSKEVQYHVMEMLYPATELMNGICDVMPAMGCATSFMWKAASITLLTGQIMKEGAEYQSMEYWMNMNKEMMERGLNSTLPKPTVTMEDVLKNMSSTHNASNNVDAKGVMEVMKWLSQITRKSCDKDMMGREMDGKMTMMSLMEGVGAVIKYSFMEAGMTKWDSLFKSMVEMGIMEDQDSNIMKAVYEAVKDTYEEYGIKKEDSELMPMVIKHTVEMADSTQLLHFYYAKIAKAKIDSMMAKSGMEKEKDSDEKDEEDEEEMMEWIKKEVAMEMKRMMPNNTKAPIFLEDGMKYVKMSLDAHKMKKLSSCYELWESYHCLESKFHLVPQESRPLVNVTIGAMLKMATHLCEPTKCFSCKGAISNEECNRQMPQNCMESQGCYTEVKHGKITKGCAYWFEDYEGEDHTARYCSNNYCNHPMMTVWKEDDKRCKLEEAVTCMFDFMPSLLLSQTPNMRQAFKTSHCMTKSTEGCMMEEGKYINHVGEMVREATLKGTCSGGDRAEYECGLRSLFALSQAVHNPVTSRKTVCQMLNSTYLVMVEAMKKGTCNEYEAVESYYGLQSILEIIGDDYCPGVIPNDPTLCSALLMNQINDSNSMCDVKGVHDCMDDEELAMKVKYLEYANGRDIDQFCRETHSAMMCMMKKSAKCSLDVQKELSKNTTAKYGFINNICPMVKITHELCTPVEMPARKCNVGMASLCLASFDPKKVNLCTMTDTQIDEGLRCMSENMTGCNALQMSPMMYSMQWVLTTMVLNCSTHTPRMLTKTGGMSYGSIDLLFKEYFNYVFDIKDASFRTDMPMAKMLDTMMFFKTSSMAAEWNATKLYMDLDPRLRNVTDTVGMVMGQNLKMDRKGGLAKCMLHLASHTSRALMYPVFSNMIMCEAMTTTQACLRALDLLPVTQMDVWIMLDHIQNEREKVCMTYIEDVGKIGYALMNLSSSVMNSTAPGQGQVKKIVGDMVNGTLNMTMHNKDDLMMVARDVIDMFLNNTETNTECNVIEISTVLTYNAIRVSTGMLNPKSEWPSICMGLHEMNKTLAPMMGKCSQWHQMAYHGMMQWIHNSTMGMCESEYMNFTVETTCQADASVMCLKYIMPYLNGQSTPKDKMCRNLQATSLCVQLHTRTCSSNEMVNVTRTMDYIHSIVGDSCPYITAASKCPRIANTPVPNKCEAEMAYQCGDILGVGTDGKIDASVCSKLPEMFQCISANLSGCSAFVLAEAMSYAEWALDQVNKVCSQEAMANMLYSQLNCQPPNVCSLTKAYKCYDVIADQPTCTADQAASILACARQHLLGCNMFQIQIFNNTMGIGRDLAPTCAAYTVDMAVVDQADRTDMAGLNYCAESFRHNLTAALLDPNNAYARFCKSFTEANECMMYGLNDEEEMFLRHLLGYSYNVTSEMVTALCRDESMFQQSAMMETTRKDEPSTCMLDMAAQCLSASAFPTIMASTMTMEDKHNFCDMNTTVPSVYMRMVTCVYGALNGCSEESTAPFTGIGAMLTAIHSFSGVCAKEFWTCSPSDAMQCGMDAEKMYIARMARMANMTQTRMPNGTMTNDTMWKDDMENPICQWAEDSMYCMRRNTFGCDKWVHDMVREDTEGSYCIAADMLNNCKLNAMKEEPEELPSCMDKEKKGNETCDFTRAYDCLLYLSAELENPYMDCNMMHRPYTEAMQCFERHAGNCGEGAYPVFSVVYYKAVTTVRKKCPMLTYAPCMEPPKCQMDEADHCIATLTKFLLTDKLQNDHICMAFDMAKACIDDRLKHCSMFAKATVQERLEATKYITTMITQKPCHENLELCLHRFLYSTMSVIHAEVVLANLTKHMDMIANKAMMEYMMTDKDMMRDHSMMDTTHDMTRMDDMMMAIANMTSDRTMLIKSMVYNQIVNFFTHATMNDSSAVGFVRTTYSMLHTMTSDLREYGDVHYKVKAMMCKAIHGSMTCAKNHLTKSNLSANKVNFINVTLTRMFNVMSGMCGSMQTCSLMEEPPTCQIMPAAMVAMSQVAVMFMNTTQMCKGLPDSVSMISNLTESCSTGITNEFESITAVLKDAKDTMCRVNILCQEDKAQQCINDFRQYIGTNQACSEYEKLLACVSTNTKYCENKTELGRDIEAVGRQCEPFPEFRVSEASPILRLVEGGLTRTIEVSMASSPNDTCPAGSRCTVQMKVEIHNNMDTIPSCPNGDFISQVVVPSGNTDACSYTFTTDNWQRPMRLPLVATSDMLSDSTQDVNVTVTASKYVDNVLTLARAVAKYQVVVADTDQPAACVAVGSGGLVTFDGMYVTNRYRGEFVLYKNTHKDRPYQVNIKNQACENDSTKTCTCAAMVKSVDDVFVVDYCSGAVNPMKLYKNGPLSYRTKLYRENNGNLISVVLPTGAVVAISIKNKVLSVILIPSSLDWLNTEGLCGWYEGNKYNDMRLPITQTTAPSAGDFIQAWRVQNGGSLSKGTTAYTNYQPPSYCTCAAEPGQVMRTCEEMLISKSCDINLGQDFTAEMEMLAERSNSVQTRRKRQVADPNDADYVPPELVWPTNSGITLDQATAECTRVLQQSNIAQLCQAYTGDSQTIMVQACAEVIQVNDDLTAASVSTLANIQCMVQVSMTSSSQSSDPALEAQKNAILNQMCDNDCSGNGLCKDGDCQCVGDYLGSDCSIDGSKPPVLTSLENSGECYLVDGQTTACKSVFISGENFAENGNMKCHFQPVTITANAAPQPTGSAVVTDANFLTSNLLMCAIPDSMTTNTIFRGIHIAVSYEGDVSRASQAALFLAYSPTCYMCNMTTGMCMTDKCIIGSTCYSRGQLNPADSCKYCDPDLSSSSWSTSYAQSCQSVQPTQPVTCPTVITTPCPSVPTCAPTGNQGQVGNNVQSTPRPDPDEKALPIALGVAAGIFLIASVVLCCKVQKLSKQLKDRNGSKYGSDSSPRSSSINGSNNKDFDNLAYDNFEAKRNTNIYTPPSETSGPPKTFPQYTDGASAAVVDETASKL